MSDRPTASTITDVQLDALYAERDRHSRDAQLWADAAAGADRLRQLAENDRDQDRLTHAAVVQELTTAWQSARRLTFDSEAKEARQRRAHQRTEAERNQLAAERDRLAAAVQRIEQMAERWRYTGDRKGGPLLELLTALAAIRPAVPAEPLDCVEYRAEYGRDECDTEWCARCYPGHRCDDEYCPRCAPADTEETP